MKNSEYTLKELKEIYTRAERKANTQVKTIEHKIEENSKQLDKINSEISKIYSEKINKIISIEKFKELYSELNEKI